MRKAIKHSRRQEGAVAVTFALMLVFILGFMGLALDLGHAFVIKTELQTATDACALAAAQELDGEADAIKRATNAGIAAGNINRVNLQSANWSAQPKLKDTEITFFDSGHASTTDPASARFVRCDHVQGGTTTPLLNVLSSWSSTSASAAAIDVRAFAEATTTPSQSTCPLPLALVARDPTKPAPPALGNYGFTRGEWIVLKISQNSTTGGQIGWANLTGNGSNGASVISAQLQGYCGSKANDPIMNASSGTMSSLSEPWNNRFGIYKNTPTATDMRASQPDFTGYGYTSSNWNAKDKNGNSCCAYDNNAAVKDTTHPSFLAARAAFLTCRGTVSSSSSVQTDCGAPMGYSQLVTGQNTAVSGGPSGDLYQYGTNRRVMPVPVVGTDLNTTSKTNIIDFVCMLMLQPMPGQGEKNITDVSLEYLGNAAAPDSPCRASGLPGGTAGPLVPVLVR